jgi:hypothetical protein
MASLAEIQALVEQIKADLPLLVQRSQVAPQQIVIAEGLSDLSERLGLIQAGEFRAGNGKEPGFGFSGTRMGYPAFAYASDTWHLAGVNADVLQFGLSATTGKAYFAGGSAILDVDGAVFEAQNNQSYFLFWKTDDDQSIVGKIGAFYVGTDSGIEVVGQTKTGFIPVAHLMTADADGNFLTGIEVRGDGQVQIDMRTSTDQTANAQVVRLLSRISNTNTQSEMLKLELESTGTPTTSFGVSVPVYAESAGGNMRRIGGFRWLYADTTDGAEDSHLRMYYIHGGVETEFNIAQPDDWYPAFGQWTRVSDTSFTSAGNATARFRKGTLLRWAESGVTKYGVVLSSTFGGVNTTINMIPTSDYVMATTPDVGSQYVSHGLNPEGFPAFFNYTPSYTGTGGGTFTGGNLGTRWKPVGLGQLHITAHYNITAVGTATGYPAVSTPVTIAVTTLGVGRENATTGDIMQAMCAAGTARITSIYWDNSSPLAAGNQILQSAIIWY